MRHFLPAASRQIIRTVSAPYEDASGTPYHALIGEPILIYGADDPGLKRALDRALARDVVAVYTREMFAITHDAANRARR